MFQWTGGYYQRGRRGTSPTRVRSTSPVPNEKGFYNDGTLDNSGTIIQTGTGNLGLHSDSHIPDHPEDRAGWLPT